MSLPRLIGVFARTIDSYEAYKEAIKEVFQCDEGSLSYYGKVDLVNHFASTSNDHINSDMLAGYRAILTEENLPHTWWYNREQVRVHTGIYPPRSNVMQKVVELYGLHQWCVHPSKDADTPEAVAYTPSPEFGQRDRQLKVGTFDKFLRKHCPLLTDKHIAAIGSAHRAEIDPTLSISTDPMEVAGIYCDRTHATSCMGYPASNWNLLPEQHPAGLYAALEGGGVAYIRNSMGKVTARAVVFTNKETGSKHYLRVYGDVALRRKLARNGYTEASMAGTKLKLMKAADGRMIMPYIDGAGGRQSEYDGTLGFIDAAEPDYVQLVTYERHLMLQRAGVDTRQFKGHTTVTYDMLEPADLNQLRFVCPLTGITVDKTSSSNSALDIWYKGKVTAVINVANIRARFPNAGKVAYGGALKEVRFTDDTPYFHSPSAGCVVESDEARVLCGFIRPAKSRYPQSGWVRAGGWVLTHEGYVKVEDAVNYQDADDNGHHEFADRATLRRLRSEGYVSVGVRGKMRRMLHRNNPDLVTLRDGKMVSMVHTDVRTCADGTYIHAREAASAHTCNMVAYVHCRDPKVVFTLAQLTDEYTEGATPSQAVSKLRYSVRGIGTPYTNQDGTLGVAWGQMRVFDWVAMGQVAALIDATLADPVKLAALETNYYAEGVFVVRQWLQLFRDFEAAIAKRDARLIVELNATMDESFALAA